MQKSLFEENVITSLGSVDEEGLNNKGGNNTKPSPNEDCCSCCGRPLSELTPFGKSGYPLKGNYEGQLMLITTRPFVPFYDILETIYYNFTKNCSTDEDFQKAEEKLVRKYGEKKVEFIKFMIAHICVEPDDSLECRDCIVLDDYEYYDRLADRHQPERCDCCGRLLGELKPFTAGHPVASHFKGKLLTKRYRPETSVIEDAKILNEIWGNCITYEDRRNAREKLIPQYGEEEAMVLWIFAFFLLGQFKKSWECTDCIALDSRQYLEKKLAKESVSAHDSSG
jgi:hypothetical protein